MSKSGYKVEVELLNEKQESDIDDIQKLNATLVAMPANVPLKRIYNRKLLKFAGLTVEELQQVEEFESQNVETPATGEEIPAEGAVPAGEATPIPEVPDIVGAPVAPGAAVV